MPKLIRDKYRSARGGHSRILDVRCDHCDTHVAFYQKDGPGMLKRMYLDRILDVSRVMDDLSCPGCSRTLASLITYAKEGRPAYRLYAGSVAKKTVSLAEVPATVREQ